MKFSLFISLHFILLFVFICSSSAQTPPNITGTWDDTICNLLPLNANIYRQRKVEFGSLSNSSLPSNQTQGTWKETTNYYKDNKCVANQLDYTTILMGTYVIGASANLQNFYDLDLRLSSKLIIVYTEDTVEYISSLSKCTLTDLLPNVYYDINEANCPALYLLPIQHCPVIRDICRRDESTLWLGSAFPGNPPSFVAPCRATRNKIYDPYSFSFFQTAKEEVVNYQFADGFLDFNPSSVSGSANQKGKSSDYDVIYLDHFVVNSTSNLTPSFFLFFFLFSWLLSLI